MTANAFPPWLDQIRLNVEEETGTAFNSCLANYYRSGKDSVDWHADDEAILGQAPIIASITLGEERTFQMRHRLSGQRFNLSLPHGSLLLMGSGIQQYWHHRLPKTRHLAKPRINFTFRYVNNT
jgi:alkylated DNA repair dioxygenase AlkB